jgi:hypothetical protein
VGVASPARLVTARGNRRPGPADRAPVRYGDRVTVWETVLVFAVLPLAGLAVLALLTVAPGASRAPRYRVGRSWDFDPVWYVARPEVAAPAGSAEGRAALAAASGRALPSSAAAESASLREDVDVPTGSAPASVLDAPRGTARGGASGEW